MISVSVDPIRRRVIGRIRVDGPVEEPRTFEVVFRPGGDAAEAVALSDATSAEYPYSTTLEQFSWDEAEHLGELLTKVVAEARHQGWLR